MVLRLVRLPRPPMCILKRTRPQDLQDHSGLALVPEPGKDSSLPAGLPCQSMAAGAAWPMSMHLLPSHQTPMSETIATHPCVLVLGCNSCDHIKTPSATVGHQFTEARRPCHPRSMRLLLLPHHPSLSKDLLRQRHRARLIG
jgi:hypothetical protein